jgi:hypothetical protein
MPMRRFGARWRDASTPAEVLDVFKIDGRYEVLLRNWTIGSPRVEWADGLDLDADGYRFPSFELEPYAARHYRARFAKKRQTWASLPAPVRAAVGAWLKDD